MKKNSSKVSKSVKKMGEKEGENQNAALSSGATDIDALQGKELGGVFAGSELLQSVEDAISAYLVTTPKGELIYCNKAFLKIFGFRTKEEASANPVSKLYYNPADRARFLSALHENKRLENFEAVHVSVDGKIINTLENMYGVFDEEGQLIKVIGNLVDITNRKKAEEALRVNEEKYRKTFCLSPDAISINRLEDGVYVSINPGFTKIMGYTEDEIIGQSSLALNVWVNPRDREKLVETLKKEGIVEFMEGEFLTKNGATIIGLMSASVFELNGVPHIISITRDITEWKKNEEATRESEARLRAIFAAMSDVILVLDSDGRYLEIGPSNPSLLYKPPVEILGKTMHEIFPKERADYFQEKVNECLLTKKLVLLEYALEIENHLIWFAANLSPLSSNTVLLVARDITEQKKIADRLKISDLTYQGIINSIDEAIYIQDTDGTFLDVNEGAVRMYGYQREELIGKNPLFVSAEGKNDIPKVIEKVKLAFEGIPQEFEFWGKRKNGEIFPKSVRVYRGKYFERDVVIAIARDDTDRFLADKKLKESEELFRNLVENITDVFYNTDERGRMKYCSPNFFLFTGYLPEEILGHYYVRVIAQEDRNRIIDYYEKETARGVLDTNMELKIQRKDGTTFWAAQNTRIVRDETGNVLEYRTVARDVTERKEAENILRRNEERFRVISNLTSDYIFTTKIHQDGSVEVDWVMGAFENITGYTFEEYKALGGWKAILSPGDFEKDEQDFQKLL